MAPVPYYEADGIALYHGRCEEILPTLGVHADLAMVDPPYGETQLAWDRMTLDWLPVVGAALKPSAPMWLWGSLRHLLTAVLAAQAEGWRLSHDVVWDKEHAGNPHADRFRRCHEQAAFLYRGSWDAVHHVAQAHPCPSMSGRTKPGEVVRRGASGAGQHIGGGYGSPRAQGWTDSGTRLAVSVWHEKIPRALRVHPTQKPEQMTGSLIRYACPPDGLVIVPFAGGGTDLAAARANGRRAIGVEADEEYCERTASRLAESLALVG